MVPVSASVSVNVVTSSECSAVKIAPCSYHVMVGFGLPTHRHSNVILVPSSDCLMTGLSVNVGLIKSSGTGASSPISANQILLS